MSRARPDAHNLAGSTSFRGQRCRPGNPAAGHTRPTWHQYSPPTRAAAHGFLESAPRDRPAPQQGMAPEAQRLILAALGFPCRPTHYLRQKRAFSTRRPTHKHADRSSSSVADGARVLLRQRARSRRSYLACRAA